MANADDNTTFSTFKYRLLPTRKQHEALDTICQSQRILYNAALQERQDCYRKTGKGRTLFDQIRSLTELRKEKEYSQIPVTLQRWTLKRCKDAYEGFFRRLKAGKKGGFPRYRNESRWHTFGFSEFHGINLTDGRIRFKGFPSSLRVHMHRPLPKGKILGCEFKKDVKGWFISLRLRIKCQPASITGSAVGIDVGLCELCVLSNGESIPNPRVAKRAERKMRIKSRAFSRCRTGSIRRKKVRLALRRCHARIKQTRNTYLHQVSARLVREHDLIVTERLNIRGMSAGMLSKSINDAGWAILLGYISYKAEYAGREICAVSPKYTSQECSSCGAVAKKLLSQRIHRCSQCGLVLGRDHNAALNILARGRTGPWVSKRKAS